MDKTGRFSQCWRGPGQQLLLQNRRTAQNQQEGRTEPRCPAFNLTFDLPGNIWLHLLFMKSPGAISPLLMGVLNRGGAAEPLHSLSDRGGARELGARPGPCGKTGAEAGAGPHASVPNR